MPVLGPLLGVRRGRARRPGRRRDERGAVAVEAALITPVLMLLVFGMIEMSLLMKDDVAMTSAVRVAGRVASANAGAGPGQSAGSECISPCSPAKAPMLAQMAANALQQSGSALPADIVQELWVYKANAKGYPGTSTSFTTCSTDCVKYKWVAADQSFKFMSGSWTSSTINACANTPPDSVGVYLKAKHTFLTGLFTGLDISDFAVFQFEPLPTLNCAAGNHA